MATNTGLVKGLGEGTSQWVSSFILTDTDSSTALFTVDKSGNVTCAGTITSAGASDSNGNLTITNSAPFVLLADSTVSAKQLKIKCDANKAQLRETGGADGSLLVLDLANARVGVATASPSVALDVTGEAAVSGNATVGGTLGVTGAATFSSTVTRTAQTKMYTQHAKVGATAGWVIDAASDVGRMATCPASQTASTLIVPLMNKPGDIITGFYLLGQVESAGGTVTLDADLRSMTAAAADITDASAATMTQISVTADTALTAAQGKTGLAITCATDAAYYLKISATTAGSTDVDLIGFAVTYTEK